MTYLANNLTGEDNFLGSCASVRIKTFSIGMPSCLFSLSDHSNE